MLSPSKADHFINWQHIILKENNDKLRLSSIIAHCFQNYGCLLVLDEK